MFSRIESLPFALLCNREGIVVVASVLRLCFLADSISDGKAAVPTRSLFAAPPVRSFENGFSFKLSA